MTVLDDAIEQIGLVSGENPAYEYQDAHGFGFFIDYDDLLPVVSGVTGKSKPGVTPQHLSKIWRIDEEAARQNIEVTSRLLKQEATDWMPRTLVQMIECYSIKFYFFTDTIFCSK